MMYLILNQMYLIKKNIFLIKKEIKRKEKKLWLGMRVFCEWRHKWRTLDHLGPLHLALGRKC